MSTLPADVVGASVKLEKEFKEEPFTYLSPEDKEVALVLYVFLPLLPPASLISQRPPASSSISAPTSPPPPSSSATPPAPPSAPSTSPRLSSAPSSSPIRTTACVSSPAASKSFPARTAARTERTAAGGESFPRASRSSARSWDLGGSSRRTRRRSRC